MHIAQMNFTMPAHLLLCIIELQKLSKLNWSQFFVVKTAALKENISKFYSKILSTEASFNIYDRLLTDINVTASFCAQNMRIKL